jgi:AcrR family transcriptional regulator
MMKASTAVRGRPKTQQKLDHLLAKAAALIAKRGFEATPIRDVGRETGSSLAGMYYYFKNKEDLLYQIQYRTFASMLESQQAIAAQSGTPLERFRRLLVGHLAFFDRHPNEMKVCTYELESLEGDRFHEVEELRRRYFRLMAGVVAELMDGAAADAKASRQSRYATLFIFGMLNWVFMWYDARRDLPVEQLGDEMLDLILNGIRRNRRTR